jgi:hypothetical protein
MIVGQLRLGRSTYGFEGRQSEECHDNQRHDSEGRQERTRNGKGEKERHRPEPSGQCSPVGNALVYSVDEGDAEQVEGDPTGERHPRTEAIIALVRAVLPGIWRPVPITSRRLLAVYLLASAKLVALFPEAPVVARTADHQVETVPTRTLESVEPIVTASTVEPVAVGLVPARVGVGPDEVATRLAVDRVSGADAATLVELVGLVRPLARVPRTLLVHGQGDGGRSKHHRQHRHQHGYPSHLPLPLSSRRHSSAPTVLHSIDNPMLTAQLPKTQKLHRRGARSLARTRVLVQPFSLPLFAGVRGRGVLRTSRRGGSPKFPGCYNM